MKTKKIIAVLILAVAGLSMMNAQEMYHSKMKKDTAKMEMKQDTMKMVNTYACPMHADVKSDKPGVCPKCGMDLKMMDMKKDTFKMGMDHSNMEMKAMYACPMHADVKSDKPGVCPKCGMDLKKMDVKEKDTHKKHRHQ